MNIDELTSALLRETALGEFTPFAHYDPDGDCIEFMISQSPYRARRLDKWVTVYESRSNGELVGSLIKNVRQLLQEFPGLDIYIDDGQILLAHILRAPAYKASDPIAKGIYRAAIKVAEERQVTASDLCLHP